MTPSRTRFAVNGRASRLGLLATACLALPLAGWLAWDAWTGPAETTEPASVAAPADLEAEVPARQFVRAHHTADTVLEERWLAAREAAAEPEPRHTMLEVEPGDTLMAMLREAGIDRREAYDAITALSDVYSPRKLKPGQEIRLAVLRDGGEENEGRDGESPALRLLGLDLRASVEQDVKVQLDDDGFVAKAVARPLSEQVAAAEGRIDSSLYQAATASGVPMPVLIRMIRVFSFDVDFQRELRRGDSFEVLYEAFREIDGSLAKTGNVLYAALTLSGERLEVYRYTTSDGETDYFDAGGESVRNMLMRTPIDGARLSSGYGMRKHPILGYSRMHKGLDFAAPRGTPIYAAGNGVVELAGWHGGHGKYVRLRHNGSYKTAYGHMSGLAEGVRSGARVEQGEVIGYVGSTGQSTGPHLHYEVLRNGTQVNPRSLKLPSGRTLTGEELERFEAARADIDHLRKGAPDGTRIAQAGCAGEGQDGDEATEAQAC